MQNEQTENDWEKTHFKMLLIKSHEVEFEQIYVFVNVKVYLPCQMNGI